MPCFVHILPVLTVQKLLKSVKIWQSCSQMYTATFYEPRQKCTFWFFQVRCAHKSGDVIHFIIVACGISWRLKWYKNYKNPLRLAKVIVKNKMSLFYGSLCRCLQWHAMQQCVCVFRNDGLRRRRRWESRWRSWRVGRQRQNIVLFMVKKRHMLLKLFSYKLSCS